MKAVKFFWLFSVLTLAALAAVFAGYTTLPVAVSLLFITMLLVKFSGNPAEGFETIRSELSSRIGSIESGLGEITRKFEETRSSSELTLGALDKIKGELQLDVKNSMDRMAERLIDFENGMNQMKRTFSAAVASLDDRMRAIEPKMSMESQAMEPASCLQPAETLAPEMDEYIELEKQPAQ